jgi:hypothetical protein
MIRHQIWSRCKGRLVRPSIEEIKYFRYTFMQNRRIGGYMCAFVKQITFPQLPTGMFLFLLYFSVFHMEP